MICVYVSDTEDVSRDSSLKELMGELPENLHARAHRYKIEKDALNFAMGRILLKRGLKDLGSNEGLETVDYRKSGKPFLENVYFNISHTEGRVVCVLSTEGEIGIDIEKRKPVNLENFKSWFTDNEWKDIHQASSPTTKFYWYWTRKESIIKALGVDLSYLHRIEIDPTKEKITDHNKEYYLKNLDLGNEFSAALCSEAPIHEILYR